MATDGAVRDQDRGAWVAWPGKPWASCFFLVVRGKPAPQGSKRHVGNGVLREMSPNLPAWREAVRHAAQEELMPVGDARWESLDGPLVMQVTFTLRKPTGAPKRTRTWPCRTPDLSKLVRSTEDALTDAGVWTDDARVVRCLASKVYPGEGYDALDTPGCVVRIWRMEADSAV